MNRKEPTVLVYMNAISIRRHNKKTTIIPFDDDTFQFSLKCITKRTVEGGKRSEISAISRVTDKGILKTDIRLTKETLLDMIYLLNQLETNHKQIKTKAP